MHSKRSLESGRRVSGILCLGQTTPDTRQTSGKVKWQTPDNVLVKMSFAKFSILLGLTLAAVSHCAFAAAQIEPPSNRLEENTENLTTVAPFTTPEPQEVVPGRDVKASDLPTALENWQAPEILQKYYPYYISGFDDDDRPIWIVELGKYDIRSIVEAGPAAVHIFDKFTAQAALRMVKSHKLRNPEGNDLSYIVDFEGLNFDQLASLPTVGYIIKLARAYSKLLEDHTNIVIIVNANYVTEILLNFVRPILGGLFQNLEVYGTNREKWIPRILSLFPKNQLPEWYGGVKNFVPYKVYG